MFNSEVLSKKLHANEISGLREFRAIFGVARKSICGPLSQMFIYVCWSANWVILHINYNYSHGSSIITWCLGLFLFGLVSTISALALLLMHWDHHQFGLYF